MDAQVIRQIMKGAVTFIPGVYNLFAGHRTGGTDSARYCYSVWLRHLIRAQAAGLPTYPRTVAELGPGDSLGIGLAALLTGAERYVAFDVVPYGVGDHNLDVFDQLVELLRVRTPIPGDDEFPRVRPQLDSYGFPNALLDEARLDAALAPTRVEALRRDLQSLGDSASSDARISYIAPWYDNEAIQPASIDLIYSQAVLEHVDELPQTYAAMRAWLAPDGFVSHTIDYASHGLSKTWNGHWAIGDLPWTILRGRRPFLLNREPHSTHRTLLCSSGFEVVTEDIKLARDGLVRGQLPQRYRNLPDSDLVSRGAYIQAVCRKP
jgi:hypothetical protein